MGDKLRIYVDTSVIGGCLDIEFDRESQALLQMVRDKQVVLLVSELLGIELRRAGPAVRAVLAPLPAGQIENVPITPESLHLRDAYLAASVVGPRHANDAHHIALATVARADLVVSWNFKHIVHWDRIRLFNAVNLREGYSPIDIRSPREVVS